MRLFLISWALSAVLQQEFLLSSWLDVLQQDIFEEPVETVQDVLKRNFSIVGRFEIEDTGELSYPDIDLLRKGPYPDIADKIGTIQLSTGRQWNKINNSKARFDN